MAVLEPFRKVRPSLGALAAAVALSSCMLVPSALAAQEGTDAQGGLAVTPPEQAASLAAPSPAASTSGDEALAGDVEVYASAKEAVAPAEGVTPASSTPVTDDTSAPEPAEAETPALETTELQAPSAELDSPSIAEQPATEDAADYEGKTADESVLSQPDASHGADEVSGVEPSLGRSDAAQGPDTADATGEAGTASDDKAGAGKDAKTDGAADSDPSKPTSSPDVASSPSGTEAGKAQANEAQAGKAEAGSDKAAADGEPAAPAEAPGWHEADGSRYYVGEGGQRLTGEQQIGGAWYYLDPAREGLAATGLVRQAVSSGSGSFKLAYYGEDGARLTGLQSVGGQTYWFDPQSGALTTGYVSDGGSIRFFDLASGSMVTGEMHAHNGWHDFGQDGSMSTGFTELPGKTVFYDGYDGSMQYGIQRIGDNWYYFDENDGSMARGEKYVAGAWRFYDEGDGHLYSTEECIQRIIHYADDLRPWTDDADTWRYQQAVVDAGGPYCEIGPCISYIWYTFRAAGMTHFLSNGLVSGWPDDYLDDMASQGRVSPVPVVGSIVFWWRPGSFADSYGLSASHAELVVGVNGDGTFTSLGAIYGGIHRRVYSIYDSEVGYGLPFYFY